MGTYKFKQYNFGGTWVPDADPTLIGDDNFSELVNLRYTDTGLELVYGMSKLTTVVEDSDIISLFTKSLPTKTVVLCQVANGNLYQMDLQPGSNITSKPSSNTLLYSFGSTAKVTYEDGPNGDIIINHPTLGLFVYNPDVLTLSALYEGGASGISSYDATITNYSDNFAKGIGYTLASPGSFWLIFPRPINKINFTITSATAGSGATVSVDTYTTADGVTAITPITDTTNKLTTSGYISFTTPTTIVPTYYDGLQQYFYRITVTVTSNIVFSNITASDKVNELVSIWDGTLTNPILCRRKIGSTYTDYTLEVNYASAKSEYIGVPIQNMTAGDTIEVGFSAPISGIVFNMIENRYNTTSTLNLAVYNGGVAGTQQIETRPTGQVLFSKKTIESSFYISDHKKTQIDGKSVYMYAFTLTGSGNISADVMIDTISGVSRPTRIRYIGLSTVANSRVFITRNNDNFIEYSYPGISNVWVGKSASDFGTYGIKVGDKTPPTALKGITNIYDGGVASSVLIMKKDKTYVLTGDTPENFKLYLISEKYGCSAINSIQQVRFTFATTQGPKNALIWLSSSGPVISDGSVVLPLSGINKYFDIKNINPQADATTGLADNNVCINIKRFNESTSYYDPNYDEYNLLVPQGTLATTLEPITTLWLTYNNRFNKWYQKYPNNGLYPTSFAVTSTVNGRQYVYGISSYVADASSINKLYNSDFSSASTVMVPGNEYTNVNFNNWTETYGSNSKEIRSTLPNYKLEFNNRSLTSYNSNSNTLLSDKFIIKPDVGYNITSRIAAACYDDRTSKTASTTTASIVYYNTGGTEISSYQLGTISSSTNTVSYGSNINTIDVGGWPRSGTGIISITSETDPIEGTTEKFSNINVGTGTVSEYSSFINTLNVTPGGKYKINFRAKCFYTTGGTADLAFVRVYSISSNSVSTTVANLQLTVANSYNDYSQEFVVPADNGGTVRVEFYFYYTTTGSNQVYCNFTNAGIIPITKKAVSTTVAEQAINTFIDKIGGTAPAVPANTSTASIKFETTAVSTPFSNSTNLIGSTMVSEQASATANKYIYSLGNVGDTTWDGTAITGEIQTGDLMLENTPWLDTKLRNLMMFADYPEQVRVKVEYTNDQEVKTVVTDQEFTNLPLRINKYVIDMNKSSWTHRIKFYITGIYCKLLGWGLKYSIERETE